MHERFRLQLLGWWARFVCRHPVLVLVAALAGAAGSVAWTVMYLGFEPDRNALISPNLDWNQRFDRWRSSFEGNDDIFVVVDTGDPGRSGYEGRLAEARAFVSRLGPRIAADPDVGRAVWGFPGKAFSPKTVRLLPMDRFRARVEEVVRSEALLASATPAALLGRVLREMTEGAGEYKAEEAEDAIAAVRGLVGAIGQVVSVPTGERAALGALVVGEHGEGWRYLASDNGRLLFIRVTPRKAEGALSAIWPAITSVRGLIEEEKEHFSGVEAGLTGVDVIEADETEAATRDSALASAIATVLIAGMLVSAFRGWRTPLLAVVALLIGVAWSFGFLTVVVGHLQVLSVVFCVILLGLGIDTGVHLASRLERVRWDYPDTAEGFEETMRDCLETVGPGAVTGAVTTSAAFCTTLLTDFRGVAEMGGIAAAGVLLCLAAMFGVYPALLRLCASGHSTVAGSRRWDYFDERWVLRFVRRPRLTLFGGGVLVVVSLVAAAGMSFDYDLMNLQPRGVSSVHWQQKVVRDGEKSVWSGVSVVGNLEEARARKAAFLELPSVADVGGIGLLFPADEDEKLRILEGVRFQVSSSLPSALKPEDVEVDVTGADLTGAMAGLRLAGQVGTTRSLPDGVHDELIAMVGEIDRVLAAMGRLVAKQREAGLWALQREYEQWRSNTARSVEAVLDVSPLSVDDFPKGLLEPYVSREGAHEGGYSLEVSARLPVGVDSALDPRFLRGFIRQLEEVDPEVTGVVVQVYRSGFLILRSYQVAGVYALAVVFSLVWLDFRSVRSAVLSLAPVGVGFALTFGVMRLLGMRVNPANIIVLPLMFGIGVDAGVHMLHRHREDPGGQPGGLTRGTGKGITVTSLTTMIGFGCMMIASHRGIAGLGFVLALGVGLTLVACWTIVPAWLEMRSRRGA